MSLISAQLNRLESRIKKIIEGSASRLFSHKGADEELANQLLVALQSGIRTMENGEAVAANLYMVSVASGLYRELLPDTSLQEKLAQILQESALQAGIRFYSPPVVRIVENTQALPDQLHVTARMSIENLAKTSSLIIQKETAARTAPERAFLVVNGIQVFPLEKSVINIGRRPDNDLVLADSRVSRVHAQLRAIQGFFMIFDLDSTGGTFVNEQRVYQSVLYPGDVISIGGIPLVYGEEETSSQTQPMLI